MKVKTRLSLFCSLAFSIVFTVISILIYGLYYKNVKKAIFSDLAKTARISALFHLEEDELSAKEFDKIRQQFEEIVSASSYLVYNSENKIAYGSHSFDIPPPLLEKIRQNSGFPFTTTQYLCYGIFYIDNQGDFVIVAKENKAKLYDQTNRLLWILIPLFTVGIGVIVFLSRWIAQVAYRPFSETIAEVNQISTNDLDVQIKSPQTKDELQDLIDTFNNLLAKISETVIIQKDFVRYVSHEFKTPLASMLGNLDLFSLKDRTPEEYHQLSERLIRQIFQIEEILDTLIIVSDLRKDEKGIIDTRLDDLIWEIINKIKGIYPLAKILVNINILPEDEARMLVSANRTQLLIALFNLIENAVKYSPKDNVEISLHKEKEVLCLIIADKGIGIPEEQLLYISKPFYRADNTTTIQGSGIGLSLALRIFDKNNIRYNIQSQLGKGTQITVYF